MVVQMVYEIGWIPYQGEHGLNGEAPPFLDNDKPIHGSIANTPNIPQQWLKTNDGQHIMGVI